MSMSNSVDNGSVKMVCRTCNAKMTTKGKIIEGSSECDHDFDVVVEQSKQMVFLSAPETMARDRFVLHLTETEKYIKQFEEYKSKLQKNKSTCEQLAEQTISKLTKLLNERHLGLKTELNNEFDKKLQALNTQLKKLQKHKQNCNNIDEKNRDIWLKQKQDEEREKKTIDEINKCIDERPRVLNYPVDLNFEFYTFDDMKNAITYFGTFVSTDILTAPNISYENAEAKESELEKLRLHLKVKKPIIIPSFKNVSLLFDTIQNRLCLSFRLNSNTEEKDNDTEDALWITVECIANSSEKAIANFDTAEKSYTADIGLREVLMDERGKYKMVIDNEFNDNKNRYIHVRARLAYFTKDNIMNPGEWLPENVHLMADSDIKDVQFVPEIPTREIPARFVLKIQHNKNGKFKQRVMKPVNNEYTMKNFREIIVDSLSLNPNDEIVIYANENQVIARDDQILALLKPNEPNDVNCETL